MASPRSEPRTVLVTGATTGVGLALSRLLRARTDMRLILTARPRSLGRFEAEGIEEDERTWLRPLDVLEPDQRDAVVREADDRWGGVDVLVNNAGVTYRSVMEHVTEGERLEQMNVNFRSPMELARLVLPGMRAKRGGHIINVSSVGGMMAMPTMAVYSASKFALEGASEALWYEVKPWGVRVSLVEPGFVHSDAFTKVKLTELAARAVEDSDDPYHQHYRNMEPFIGQMMGLTLATPQRVARKIFRTMHRRRPPLRISATPDALLFELLRRVLPRRLYHVLLYWGLPRIRLWGPRD